jgi:nucleotide-binding universal stress UspA family protein
MMKHDNFDFSLIKQKIMIVDANIRRAVEDEIDENYFKNWSKFGYRFGITVTLVLVVAWPVPLYLSGYVFSLQVYGLWVGIAVTWAGVAATVLILLPLIESRTGIVKVLKRIGQGATVQIAEQSSSRADEYSLIYEKKILVPVDGSQQSLRALNYAATIYNNSHERVLVYVLNVIEWADEHEEYMDEELASAIEEQGRRVLRSIVLPKSARECQRMIKLGNPARKIVEMAEKLKVNMIVMGATGLSNSKELGHVSSEVLKLTSIPVMFSK